MRLLILTLIALCAPTFADACSRAYTTLFENFDRSATVAHARVHHENGKIVLDVIRAIKGSPGNRIRLNLPTRGAVSTCTPQLKMRSTGIIFLTAEGHFAAAYDSFPRASRDLLAAMHAYGGAADATARAAVLVDLIAAESKLRRIAFDAALALADDPAALVKVTEKDRDRLRLVDAEVDSYLPVALSRLGAPGAEYSFRVFEAVTKPDELADAMLKATDSARAAAAFERCERVHAKRLFDVRNLVAAAEDKHAKWDALAKACRTGTPVPEL